MSNDNGKISIRQAMIFIILIFCSPAIRYIPIHTAEVAKQAAWLSPIVAFILEIIYFFVFLKLIKKNIGKSYVDIIKDVTGKIFGNIIIIIYFLWITFLLSYNVRMYVARILGTSMPNVSMYLLLIVMLTLVLYVVKHGIIPLAKMGEIFIIFLSILYVSYNILVLPQIDVKNLFPITYKDILPVLAGGLGIMTIFAYNILVFLFNDRIDYNGETKKLSIYTIIIIALITFSVIIVPTGVFGWSIVTKMPIPFLNAMMEISIFDIIERLEAGLIMFWIIAEFIIFSILLYSAMHILKLSFKISNITPLTTMYVIGIFFLAIMLGKNTKELKMLSEGVITPLNIAMGYCMPMLICIIAKIRKKI